MFFAVVIQEDKKKIHLQGKEVPISIVLGVFTAKIVLVERHHNLPTLQIII